MEYVLDIQQTARRDMRRLSPEVAARVVAKLEELCNNLAGDVKRLIRHSPAYRLRVGDYRVLFDVGRVKPANSACAAPEQSRAYD